MNRCPTVPVAPRTATFRLRIAVKSDVSEERRSEPPVAFVDPAQEPQSGRGQIGEHLVVVHNVPAIDADAPVPVPAGVVIDRLVEEMALAAISDTRMVTAPRWRSVGVGS